MINIALENVKLILAIIFSLFLPGYFLLRIFDLKSTPSSLQRLVISFGLSFFIVNSLLLLINRLKIPINWGTIFVSILSFLIITFLFQPKFDKSEKISLATPNKKTLLIILLFVFSVVIRLFFLSERLLPQTTDLGHHMYWSQYIIHFQSLPNYGMPDFIIGEHIIFSVISILSGISVISSMPIALLFLINLFSVLACFLAAYELARCFTTEKASVNISILTLLTIGVFYAISSPQAKFVSGGVIGNTIGNFLIPLIFLLLAKFIRLREGFYPVFIILILATLAYTHHLSSFIFLYILAGLISFLLIAIASYSLLKKTTALFLELWIFLKTFFNVKTALSLLLFVFLILFIRVPSYLNSSAIDTAVGAPSKETRTGLTLGSILETAGPWRFFYGTIGIITLSIVLILAFRKKIDSKVLFNTLLAITILCAWGIVIFGMSYAPALLKIDIPSNRVGSYIAYPFAFLSAIGIFYLLSMPKKSSAEKIIPLLAIILFGTGFISGMAEISINKKDEADNKEVYQTYAASQYLNRIILPNQQILKDHLYLAGDSWVKLFFMKDYRFPLSRTTLKRYDDPVKPRETCTRDMIAIPDDEIGKKCFLENNVKYIILRKNRDTAQFERSENFSPIFANTQTVIYQRNY